MIDNRKSKRYEINIGNDVAFITHKNILMEEKMEYSNGEIAIVWQSKLCIHAGVCVRTLPNVYHPKERPWIKPLNATTEEIIEQVKNCPSGALTYKVIESKK